MRSSAKSASFLRSSRQAHAPQPATAAALEVHEYVMVGIAWAVAEVRPAQCHRSVLPEVEVECEADVELKTCQKIIAQLARGLHRSGYSVGHHLGDPLHGLARELSQVPVEGQLVAQDLIGLDPNVCEARFATHAC